ncbi:hypothetical protein B0H21DRAFT_660500, partial [Amylocystis lapponica]
CYLSIDSPCCFALCPNPDLAGVGVRAAFYGQSILNTLLVIFSPRDSVPSAWASTLLTASLVVAAIVQKVDGNITLHHATLVLNFSTLSCISSLAVAPILPIWRLTPGEYYARELQLARRTVTGTTTPLTDREENVLEEEVYVNTHKKKIKKAQNKERVVLALALLIQVVLQWAWGIILFVSPSYSQTMCSGTTRLRFFMRTFTASEINHGSFYVWPLWLLFCLGITLGLTIILAVSSPDRAYELSRRSGASSRDESAGTPVVQQLYAVAISMLPPRNDVTRQMIFCGNVFAFALWILFILTSELQRTDNCNMVEGENDFGGFGQITAVLLSLAPLWSLTVALYKYPSLWRKQKQRKQCRSNGETQSL